jgi:hypothetical protein
MIDLPKRRGYQLHAPYSPEAEARLVEHHVTWADLARALAELERTEGIAIRTIAGINDDAVFGTRRESWRPDLPDAYDEPFIPLLWLQVLELLGRVPEGSTAQFLDDGILPDCELAGWAGYPWARLPSLRCGAEATSAAPHDTTRRRWRRRTPPSPPSPAPWGGCEAAGAPEQAGRS